VCAQGEFDYPRNQRLLHEYNDAFQRVGRIIRDGSGPTTSFWLTVFKQWLESLQQAFDRDLRQNCISAKDGLFHNVSDEGMLAYKLLAQTGDSDNPFDIKVCNEPSTCQHFNNELLN
jgi:patched 1 protein